MRRRDFIKLLGGTATIWPLATHAQRPAMPLVAYISAASERPDYVRAFLAGLRDAGLVPERDVEAEFYWSRGTLAPVEALATRLLERKVAVIVTGGGNVAREVHKLTATIPIIMVATDDPVATGLVASLSRPGGNVTGLSSQGEDITGKLVEILRDLRPQLRRLGVVNNAASRAVHRDQVTAAARSIGVEVHAFGVGTRADIERAFAEATARGVEGVVVLRDFLIETHRELIVALAERHRLPTIYEQGDFVRAGGLVSYSADFVDSHYRASGYVARILRGAKPADMPVEQPTKFELVVNLKAAKALGLTVPESLLARADEVIE